jgi:hypothetical protein
MEKIDWDNLIEEIKNDNPSWYNIVAEEIKKDVDKKLIKNFKKILNGKCK